MQTRVEPRAFVNFSVRLDLASNERRRRLEKALGLSAPRLLERLFCNFENHLLNQFSDTHAKPTLLASWTPALQSVVGKHRSHLRASSISTAKDATLKSWHS